MKITSVVHDIRPEIQRGAMTRHTDYDRLVVTFEDGRQRLLTGDTQPIMLWKAIVEQCITTGLEIDETLITPKPKPPHHGPRPEKRKRKQAEQEDEDAAFQE